MTFNRAIFAVFAILLTLSMSVAQTMPAKTPAAGTPEKVELKIDRQDPALDKLVPPDAVAYRVARDFIFIEGPIWIPSGKHLLFSDTRGNRIYKYDPSKNSLEVFRDKSGYAGDDIANYVEPGTNGLTLDPQGRLTMCQHGNRRVVRLDANGSETVLADRFEGKRLNSPNDLVYRKDGTLYFTDPAYGLRRVQGDPPKELDYMGVYALRNGKLSTVATDQTNPNGIALSPDEKSLYVGVGRVLMRYPVNADGSTGAGTAFFDMSSSGAQRGGIDGLKVDVQGNRYVTGPGGVWIISASGKHLGTITLPEQPANVGWGDDDGRTLYFTARTSLYKVRMNVPGYGRFGR
ncbi:MAG: SMP-30/gluconolactonase/LRE family protein [Candidatus Korobacteraceae bacterium]